MGTTTIRLEDDLKSRIAAAAEREGKSAHAFMHEAILRSVAQAEEHSEFVRIAQERWKSIVETGMTVSWDEARVWLEARARGENPPRPQPRKLNLSIP
jgi:predicted transcriptional regulator